MKYTNDLSDPFIQSGEEIVDALIEYGANVNFCIFENFISKNPLHLTSIRFYLNHFTDKSNGSRWAYTTP